MKYFHKLTLAILIAFCSTQVVRAQEVSDYSSLSLEEYKMLTLPPISVLFENAKQNPIYEMAQTKEEIERKLLSKEKRHFLSFFSIRGSYQYGMFGNDATYTDVYTPVVNNYTTTAQNSYTIGAGLNIPLDQLFDLGSRVKRQKLALKVAQLDKEVRFEEQKREIIQMYSMAISQMSVLKLRAEALELANAQYDIAEKDFSFGTIDTGALSTEKSRQSIAREALENSKFELTKSLMILEVIANTPILKK